MPCEECNKWVDGIDCPSTLSDKCHCNFLEGTKALKRKLFDYFVEEHGLPLLASELEDIVGLFNDNKELEVERHHENKGSEY